MPRRDVLIYGVFETPAWPDPPGDASPSTQPVEATATVPEVAVAITLGADVLQDAEVFVGALVPQPTIAGILSVLVDPGNAVITQVVMDDPVIDVSGGGAAPDVVEAAAGIPSPAVSISGTGAVFGGNFGGTF